MRTFRLPSLDPNVTKCAVSSVGVGSSHDGTATTTGVVKYLVEYVGPAGAAADVAEDADAVRLLPPPHATSETTVTTPVAVQAILDKSERFMVTPRGWSFGM